MNKPNLELLIDLFNSEEWPALKSEIEVCLLNAERDLKRPGVINRDFRAGECTGYETILKLEEQYKNADVKREPNS